MEFCILLRRPLSFDDYYLGCFLYVALTSWRSETSNISMVVLDKKKVSKERTLQKLTVLNDLMFRSQMIENCRFLTRTSAIVGPKQTLKWLRMSLRVLNFRLLRSDYFSSRPELQVIFSKSLSAMLYPLKLFFCLIRPSSYCLIHFSKRLGRHIRNNLNSNRQKM